MNMGLETEIIRQLLAGEIATVPTETVEGYAVRLDDERAVRALMEKKGRDFDSGKVFTLVPESLEDIAKYVVITPKAEFLIKKYFPGEITLILKKNPEFRHFYYDHFETVGVRIPDYPLFREVLPVVGALILTSANPRGGTPRSCTGHLPSTVVDVTGDELRILRQGSLVVDDGDLPAISGGDGV